MTLNNLKNGRKEHMDFYSVDSFVNGIHAIIFINTEPKTWNDPQKSLQVIDIVP